jgi:hypothetical protein
MCVYIFILLACRHSADRTVDPVMTLDSDSNVGVSERLMRACRRR